MPDNPAQAQHTLVITVNDFHQSQNLFLSGTINNWDAADPKYQLSRINYFRWEITLRDLSSGEYAFKLTRGSAESVETTADGSSIPERVVRLQTDTTVLFSVEGWKDDQHNPDKFSDSARLNVALSRGFKYLNTNTDSSFKYALQTFGLSSNVSTNMKVHAINLQGDILVRLGNFGRALTLFREGLRMHMAERNQDSASIAHMYNEIGDVYWQMKDTAQAVQNYRLSMRWTPAYVYYHPLHEAICNRLCNMGRASLGRHELDSAKWYAVQSSAVGDKLSAITELFMGDISASEIAWNEAMDHYRVAVRLGIHHDRNLNVVFQAYQRIMQHFESNDQKDSAMIYAKRAFTTARTLQNDAFISTSGTTLAELFEKRGRYDSAIYYSKEVIRSASRQVNQEKERRTLDTYFSGIIKEQEATAERKNANARRVTYGLLAGIALLIVGGGLYRMRLMSGYERKMKEIEMRALRAQMNPHFIFNCLGSINRYIVKSDTRTASNYLTRFAKLIRLILDNSASDHISLDAEMQTLQLYLDMESLRFEGAFEFEMACDEDLSPDVMLPSMLIQPYVENAIWHGLLQKEVKGKLWVRFKKVNGHMLQAEIEDNGIGRKNAAILKSKGSVKKKSYGMQISSDRIKIINNLYKLNNSVSILDLFDEHGNAAGTKIILNIPVS